MHTGMRRVKRSRVKVWLLFHISTQTLVCIPAPKSGFFSSKLHSFLPAKVSWAELAFGITRLLSFLIVCLRFPFLASNFFLSPPLPPQFHPLSKLIMI